MFNNVCIKYLQRIILAVGLYYNLYNRKMVLYDYIKIFAKLNDKLIKIIIFEKAILFDLILFFIFCFIFKK